MFCSFATREQSLLFGPKLPANFVQTKQNVSFNYDNPQGIFLFIYYFFFIAMFVGDALSFSSPGQTALPEASQ